MKPFYERYWSNRKDLEDSCYKWQAIKNLIPRDPNLKILDFGCGKGAITEEIIKINPRIYITGVDISSKAINVIKKKIKTHEFIRINNEQKLPFKSNTFDFILALDVIEHIYDTELILKELQRVLKKNGKILISVPYHGIMKNIILSLFFFEKVFDPIGPHIRFFTSKSLKKMCKDFKIIKLGYFGRFWPLWRGMFIFCQKIN